MKVSAKNIATHLLLLLLLPACGKKEKELSPARINALADSIVNSRMDKLRRQAKEDLDRRMPIELKPKIDSIRNVSHEIGPVPVFPGDDGTPARADTGSMLQLQTRTPSNDTQR
ncbi:hypothetical protein [Taibaiella koreensis]|uniref:hypothetical protein n=1 Tax=Taibaiella koreensis TaxID=1268548 RepID=UPI000E59BC27|nr:hypothetical protein [Taibaiella koreensis]